MLGKVIKNEFRATTRYFVPIYAFALLAAAFLKIMMTVTGTEDSTGGIVQMVMKVISGFSVFTFVIAIIAVVAGTAVVIAKRFYDHFLKDEGYLTFTLPVTTGQHMAGKVITSYVWIIGGVIVILLSLGILSIGNTGVYTAIKDSWLAIKEVIDTTGTWGYVIKMVLSIVIGIYTSIMMIYTCLSVGQLWNRHRVAGAVLIFFAIYTLEQIIGTVFAVILFHGVDTASEDLQTVHSILDSVGAYSIVLSLVEAVVFTLITRYMLKNKLNLE